MRFTVKDLPMIRSNALKRWECIDDAVKQEVGLLIKDTLYSNDVDIKYKLQAASLAERIDRLNLKHEQFVTPKIDVSVADLSDEQLESELKRLEEMERLDDVLNILTKPRDEELLEYVPPIMDAIEVAEPRPLYRKVY